MIVIGSKWAAFVYTFFDYRTGGTEMHNYGDQRWVKTILFTLYSERKPQ